MTKAADLVERCQSGDARAFQELFREHREDVARLVRRMGVRPAELEDVTQEVFLQVYRSIKDFQGKSRLSTWLYRVTVNVVLMYRRSAKSRPVLVSEGAADPAPDPRSFPDEQVARKERIEAFYRLLEKLSDKKRIVFVLHELQGLSPSEIAEVVKAPVLTVRTRLFYARRELEQMLADEPALAALTIARSTSTVDEQVVPQPLGKGST